MRPPTTVFYRIALPQIFDLLISAERILAETDEQVELCPNYPDSR